ncbi:MAG: periplasmic heavy metal sensor [Bacteroidales bacterium]
MKKIFSTLVLLTIVLTLSAQEQKQEQKREMEIKMEGFMKANPAELAPKFTAEQQKQMTEFRLNLQKEMLQIDNQLNVKRAELKTLQQVEKPNMKSIYSKIDEISDLQNKKMKAMANHKNDVRSILTEEQRVKFDMNEGKCCKMQPNNKMKPGMEPKGKMRMGNN